MTGNELEEILASENTQEQETTTTETVNRDDHGRFAAKAQPDIVEQPEVTEGNKPQGHIPPAAIADARQKARETTAENDTLRRELAELRGYVQSLSHRQQPQAPQEEAKPADFWDDPDGWGNKLVTPIQQQLQQQNERWSRRFAEQQHGAETVNAAYQALGQAMQAGEPGAIAEFQRLKQSDHPFGEIVDWHKRQETMKTVGNDPNAWLEAEMKKRLADPAYQAQVLEMIRGTAANNTNRSAPVTSLPPSLNRLPSGGNAPADVDMSDTGIFAQAMRP